MEDSYVFLMSVYNDIEAENVTGILENEGIKVKIKTPGRMELINAVTENTHCVDIYVPATDYDEAMQVIEVEMVRGDF